MKYLQILSYAIHYSGGKSRIFSCSTGKYVYRPGGYLVIPSLCHHDGPILVYEKIALNTGCCLASNLRLYYT